MLSTTVPSSFHLENDNLSDANVLLLVVGQEEEVSAMEGRLHRPAEDDDDGRFRAGDDHQPLPDHQRRRNDHSEAQGLYDIRDKKVIRFSQEEPERDYDSLLRDKRNKEHPAIGQKI